MNKFYGWMMTVSLTAALLLVALGDKVQAVVTAVYDPTADMTSMVNTTGTDMGTFYPVVLGLLLILLVGAFLWKVLFGRKK